MTCSGSVCLVADVAADVVFVLVALNSALVDFVVTQLHEFRYDPAPSRRRRVRDEARSKMPAGLPGPLRL